MEEKVGREDKGVCRRGTFTRGISRVLHSTSRLDNQPSDQLKTQRGRRQEVKWREGGRKEERER